jgi:hypothetical protein
MRSMQKAWPIVALLAGCATQGGERSPPAPAAGGGSPVLLHRMVNEDAPHPTLRLSWDAAHEMGVPEGGFASPQLLDQLAASCAETNVPQECRRAVRVCREKLCRVERTIR